MDTHIANIIEKNAELLSETALNKNSYPLPSRTIISEFVTLVWEAMFPGYHGNNAISIITLKNRIAMKLEKAYNLLTDQIECAKRFEQLDEKDLNTQKVASDFIDCIPRIKELLVTDIEAMFKADPAATSIGEVIFSYPAVIVMVHHRIAHKLRQLNVPIIPRVIAEIAHSKTGIDIHPGARIGSYFAIDHGTGVVIGETSIIGNNVVIYQGVTLGAKAFKRNENGSIINEPRHPIIEDNVVIYANASILGRITIGKGSIIGGNTCTVNSLEAGSKIVQNRPRNKEI